MTDYIWKRTLPDALEVREHHRRKYHPNLRDADTRERVARRGLGDACDNGAIACARRPSFGEVNTERASVFEADAGQVDICGLPRLRG